jgi:Coenzyme PQQ synthesis protein D (PqqD)
MLAISSTIRRTRTQDGAVLLDVERGAMYCLNPLGAEILELIAAGADEHEIACQLSARYRVEIEMVHADLREFLQTMTRQAIVHRRERATEA